MVASGTSSKAVTVIIAAYNAYPHIRCAIDSVMRQSIGVENIELIVVNDGSTDDTERYLTEVASEYPSLVVVHQPNSGSPAGPRNRAITMASGRYIFFLDADDHLSDDALEAMVSVADENGTDVVLARIKGVGGRTAPKSMFQRSAPRTSLHESNVYWTLNPMKMFRTELVRRLGLRFAEDFPWGEDQPFVAGAYFGADGISILADKDYVYWAYLDDGSNITTSAVSLADRMPVADRMFDFVAERTEPGELRDRLMRRHFRVELFGSAFAGFATETDELRRKDAYRRFREIVGAYYRPSISERLPAGMRVAFHLISEDRYDDFSTYLALAVGREWPVTLEDGRAYEHAPWFGDPSRGIPAELYDVTALCRARCEVVGAAWHGEQADLTIACSVDLVDVPVESVEIELRSREGERPVVTVAQESRPPARDTEGRTLFDIRVSLGPELVARADDGALVAWCVVRAGGMDLETRLSAGAEPDPPGGFLHAVTYALHPGAVSTLTPYVTRAGNLAFRVRHSAPCTLDVGPGRDRLLFRSVEGADFPANLAAAVVDETGTMVADAAEIRDGVANVLAGVLGFGQYRVLITAPHEAPSMIEVTRARRSLVRCAEGWAVVVVRGRSVGFHRPLRWARTAVRGAMGRVDRQKAHAAMGVVR